MTGVGRSIPGGWQITLFFGLHDGWVHIDSAVVSDYKGVGGASYVWICLHCTHSACQKQWLSASSLFLTRVGVCVCIRTNTHTLHEVLGLSVSPGFRTRHLEGPKNPDGLNLSIYVFVYHGVQSTHVYIILARRRDYVFCFPFRRKNKIKRCERNTDISDSNRIWAHRAPIKGTNLLFIVSKAIIIINKKGLIVYTRIGIHAQVHTPYNYAQTHFYVYLYIYSKYKYIHIHKYLYNYTYLRVQINSVKPGPCKVSCPFSTWTQNPWRWLVSVPIANQRFPAMIQWTLKKSHCLSVLWGRF